VKAVGRTSIPHDGASAVPDASHGPAVLIVDDESLLRLTLSDDLQEAGFRVIEAADATEAVLLLNAYGRVLDIVITDIRMPGLMDGVQLADWIAQRLPAVRVIFASAYDPPPATSGKPFFRKPYDFVAIRHEIDRLLNDRG
jgi:CheY-like chemotaxis protein